MSLVGNGTSAVDDQMTYSVPYVRNIVPRRFVPSARGLRLKGLVAMHYSHYDANPEPALIADVPPELTINSSWTSLRCEILEFAGRLTSF